MRWSGPRHQGFPGLFPGAVRISELIWAARLRGLSRRRRRICAASYKLGVPLALSEPDSLAAASLTELANRLAEPVLIPVSVSRDGIKFPAPPSIWMDDWPL